MDRLFYLNQFRWYARLPLKWSLFGLAALLVCYPHPALLAEHVRHWKNPNALIEPNAESLQPLARKLRESIPPGLSPNKTLRRVEQFVLKHVPYEWDWNTWGMADYLPTVDEVLKKGKEDCDGRAVIAASLLTNLGYKSEIVTDFAHVWVKTDHGETMGPGKQKAVEATDGGLKVNWRGLAQLPRALAYGIAVFPQARELILLLVGWYLLLRSCSGIRRSGLLLCIFIAGLYAMRMGGADYRNPIMWLQWMGVGLLLAGVVLTFLPVKPRAELCETVVP